LEYGLAWSDHRSGSGTDLYFPRLDGAGTEIGDDLRLTEQVSFAASWNPSLAWTGSEFGIAFTDDRFGGSDIYFTRLDFRGTEIGSEIPLRAEVSAAERHPDLVWTGVEYGLAWNASLPGNQEVNFARFTSSGSRIGGVTPITAFTSRSVSPVPDLLWQGSEFALVWSADPTGNGEIYFDRVDASGAEIASEIQITNTSDRSDVPSLAWSGSEYGLTWQETLGALNARAYFVRLRGNGSRLGSEMEISDSQRGGERIALVFGGREYFLAWSDSRDGDWEIYLGRLSCGW